MPSIPTTRGAERRRWYRGGFVPAVVCLGLCLAVLVGLPAAGAQEVAPAVAAGSLATIIGTGEGVLLRDAPAYEAGVLIPLAAGTVVGVVAGPVAGANGTGWYQVDVGQVGWVPEGALAPSLAPAASPAVPAPDGLETDAGAGAVPATETDDGSIVEAPPAPLGGTATNSDVNLRAGPSLEAGVLSVLPPGSPVEVTGGASGAFTPVLAGGVSGWVATEYLGAGGGATAVTPAPEAAVATPGATPAPTAAPPTGGVGSATTTDSVNLRAAPGVDGAVLAELPAGTVVEATGAIEAGFFPVSYAGEQGWIASEFLAFRPADAAGPVASPVTSAEAPAEAATPPAATPELSAPAATGSGLAWPFAGGTWEVIQGYNNGTHTNRSSFSNYQYSLDWARTDGDTAGQPVYAPASGTVQWVDGGSGGILIDMGNGYGVAMFHLTIDPSIGSGDAIQQGQVVGTVSGPGGPGYAGTPHVDLTLWQLPGGGTHVSTPFTGGFAIGGREFPASGAGNEHMGAEVTA